LRLKGSDTGESDVSTPDGRYCAAENLDDEAQETEGTKGKACLGALVWLSGLF